VSRALTAYSSGFYLPPQSGQVSEWLKEPVSKTGIPATVSWVRIPPCPLPHSVAPSPAQHAGCLLGLALGDALGFVVEAEPPDVAAAYVAELRAGKGGFRSHPRFPFGQYSDDTQLARELLLSIRDAGAFDARAFACRIAALFSSGTDVGAGPGSRGAGLRLAAGVPWNQAGAPAPYAGNGSAMRAAPIGLLFAHDPAMLVRVAVQQSLVTHQDPRCAAGAVAVAGAAAMAARGGAIDPVQWTSELGALVRPIDAGMAEAIGLVAGWVARPAQQAAAALEAAGLDPGSTGRRQGISAHVVPSVAWALYAFLHAPDAYLEAVCAAIEVGGDTDTIGAMAGSLAGARLGRAALPERLTSVLNDRGRWGSEELARLSGPALG
jgi:ADP-ribosylglycohydrolase